MIQNIYYLFFPLLQNQRSDRKFILLNKNIKWIKHQQSTKNQSRFLFDFKGFTVEQFKNISTVQYKLFGIYDGHGRFGHLVSSFIKFNLESIEQLITHIEFIKSDTGNIDEMKVQNNLEIYLQPMNC